MGTHDTDAVPLWTATGHHLTRLGASVDLDRREDRLIDDVVADEWIYPAPESNRVNEPHDVSDSAEPDRRAGVILL